MKLIPMNNSYAWEYLLRSLKEYKNEPFSIDDHLLVDERIDDILDIALKRLRYLLEEPDEEIFQANFGVLFATLGYSKTISHYKKFIRKFMRYLLREPTKLAKRKVILLVDLFNLVREGEKTKELAPSIFINMLSLVDESGEGEVLKSTFGGLVERVKDWTKNPEEQKEILQLAYRVGKKLGDTKDAQACLMAYLALHGEAELNNDLYADASQAIIYALCDPEIDPSMFFQLSLIPCVEALKDSSQYSNLYELFKIMHQGCVDEFLNYMSKPNSMAALGIVEGNVLEKIRYLTLCTEGLNRNDDIPLEYLKQKLSLETLEELETMVVQAVRKGLICAKIDHASSSVMIYRSTIRTCEKDWTALSSQLKRLIQQQWDMLKNFHA